MKDRFKLFKIFSLLSIVFILLLSIWYGLIPQIIIKDKNSIVKLNGKYEENNIVVKNIFGNKKYDIKTKDNINTKKVGKYKITYSVKSGLITVKKTKIIEVKDMDSPEITLEGGDEVLVCPNKEFEELGYKAIDNNDGDITKNVEIIKNKDFIKYKVKDKAGNVRVKERKLKYEDTTAPELKLNGNSEMSIQKYSSYSEQGYSAIDNCDGDITDKVQVEGSVDTNTEGTYTLVYKVADSNGNESSIERKVTVFLGFSGDNGVSIPGVIYLTFDDGPNEGTTNVILDILKEEGVKATFFVTNKGPDYLIKREADEGHTVALHTATHNYATVYASVDAYFNDLASVHDRVQNITGIDSRIIRFPGGSSNTVSRNYCRGIMSILTQEVLNRGYRYYDWNVSSGDAGNMSDPNQVYLNVINGISKNKANIVLMHDIKWYTRDALRNIIRYGKDMGYTFEPITMDTAMVRQRVNN